MTLANWRLRPSPPTSVEKLVARARAVLHVVRLVDHQQVPALRSDQLGMAGGARHLQRGDDDPRLRAARPGCLGVRPEAGLVGALRLDGELVRQLRAPLAHQRRRADDQHGSRHSPQQVLRNQHPRFDGLAEADLVGEQGAAAEGTQHPVDRLDLVVEPAHVSQAGEAEQLVELIGEPEAPRFERQRDVLERPSGTRLDGARELVWRWLDQRERDRGLHVSPRRRGGRNYCKDAGRWKRKAPPGRSRARERLHESLRESIEQMKAGRTIDAWGAPKGAARGCSPTSTPPPSRPPRPGSPASSRAPRPGRSGRSGAPRCSRRSWRSPR